MTDFEHRVLAGLRVAVLPAAAGDPAGPPAPVRMSADAAETRMRAEVADTLVCVFRAHPHIGNVISHICREQWGEVARALRTLLDPGATADDLSPLAANILELLWAERGVTGRILKPRFRDLLARLMPPAAAAPMFAHVEALWCETCARRQAPAGREDPPAGPSPTPDGEPPCATQMPARPSASSTCAT